MQKKFRNGPFLDTHCFKNLPLCQSGLDCQIINHFVQQFLTKFKLPTARDSLDSKYTILMSLLFTGLSLSFSTYEKWHVIWHRRSFFLLLLLKGKRINEQTGSSFKQKSLLLEIMGHRYCNFCCCHMCSKRRLDFYHFSQISSTFFRHEKVSSLSSDIFVMFWGPNDGSTCYMKEEYWKMCILVFSFSLSRKEGRREERFFSSCDHRKKHVGINRCRHFISSLVFPLSHSARSILRLLLFHKCHHLIRGPKHNFLQRE